MLAVPGSAAVAVENGVWRHADLAPTVATLLGVDLPGVDGVPRLRAV
jgi:hypothetical protein